MYNDGNETFQKVCARYAVFFRFFSRFRRHYGCTELTSSVPMQYDDFAWKTDDLIENARRNRRTQVGQRYASGCVKTSVQQKKKQMLNNLVFKNLFIGTLGARDFSSAVSCFCQHRKFPPHARKTSGTQGSL